MKHSRPKNLNLFTISFPIPAIVSILHRLSGVALFILIPFLFWAWSYSLSEDGFNQIQHWFSLTWIKLATWLVLVPLCFHLVAGTRHLLMDLHLGASLTAGRIMAWLTFLVTIVLLIMLGMWIW